MAAARASVRATGRVQGVFFRAEARSRADSLGLAGWVRNEHDGSVAAVFEGPRDLVEAMVEWCRRGPSGAHVESLRVAWEDPEGLNGFRVA